jgi:hypothetical protein
MHLCHVYLQLCNFTSSWWHFSASASLIASLRRRSFVRLSTSIWKTSAGLAEFALSQAITDLVLCSASLWDWRSTCHFPCRRCSCQRSCLSSNFFTLSAFFCCVWPSDSSLIARGFYIMSTQISMPESTKQVASNTCYNVYNTCMI